ncbi:MAG: MBOAT family protein [Acidobacteria bacterium]|nr:MBOAT family protein [Acidobacteriota bacterium]
MSFHSLDFVAFFLLVVSVYWCLPHRAQNVLLLVASYAFYGWIHPWFLMLMGASTLIDWASALAMTRWPGQKRAWLGLSLVTNLGMLAFFKYFNFFVENANAAILALGGPTLRPGLDIVLPVGISFYTFQTLSYTIDVYRGELAARRSLVDVAAFVSFFPQLVAGPIERAAALLPQMERARTFSFVVARRACLLIVWGFFKKLVVADNVGIIANKVFAIEHPTFLVLWAGVFAFGIQIYADFSAYSDIARGTARWFGIELMKNFDHPYIARSPAEFWRRWHISLSTWFRDYVYIPLGGSRGGRLATARNLMATFLLSGFWHGASWNYVLWGAYHGVLVTIQRLWAGRHAPSPSRGPVLARVAAIAQGAGMFVLAQFGWLLFRETNSTYLWRMVKLSPMAMSRGDVQAGLYLLLLAVVYSLPIFVHDWIVALQHDLSVARLDVPPVTGTGALTETLWQGALGGVLLAGILVLRSRTSLDFIYFQF